MKKIAFSFISLIICLIAFIWISELTTVSIEMQKDIQDIKSEIEIVKEEMPEREIVYVETRILTADEYKEEKNKQAESAPEIVTETFDEGLHHMYTKEDVTVLTNMLLGEASSVPELFINGRTISTKCQQAAVIWTVLNRYDEGKYDSIEAVVKAPGQYHGYNESNQIDPELRDLVIDVLDRWVREKCGETDVGRVLPSDYIYFGGDGTYNYFRNTFELGSYWTWEYPDPYAN